MYVILHNIHEITGYILAAYAILVFLFEGRLAKIETGADKYRQWNSLLFWSNKIMSYLLVITFLIGGYLGTPYFSIGALWVFIKIIIFLILLGLMGGLAGKSLKQRKKAIEDGEFSSNIFVSAKKKMNVFKYTQLILVIILFYLAYWRPF